MWRRCTAITTCNSARNSEWTTERSSMQTVKWRREQDWWVVKFLMWLYYNSLVWWHCHRVAPYKIPSCINFSSFCEHFNWFESIHYFFQFQFYDSFDPILPVWDCGPASYKILCSWSFRHVQFTNVMIKILAFNIVSHWRSLVIFGKSLILKTQYDVRMPLVHGT